MAGLTTDACGIKAAIVLFAASALLVTAFTPVVKVPGAGSKNTKKRY